MKKVAGRLRLDLAQYRALEAFAQFGSELDKASQQQLARGARVVEVLKQPQYDPQPVEREVVQVYAVTGGYLDDLPVSDAKRFATEFGEYLEARHPDVFGSDPHTGDLSDETEATLEAALDAFARDVPCRPATGLGLGGRPRRGHRTGRGQARRGLGPHVVGDRRGGHRDQPRAGADGPGFEDATDDGDAPA